MAALNLSISEPLARALWALVIVTGGLLLYAALNRLILLRAQRNAASGRAGAARFPDLPEAWQGRTAILYFTTPECAACKAVQRPALSRVQRRLGERLQVIEVNAHERPDLAARWGVLSVPTTFLIDSTGTLRHVNHGVTRAEKLAQQLAGME